LTKTGEASGPGGSGGGGITASSQARTEKRLIADGDIAVIMALSDETGTLQGNYQWEEDW